MRVLILALVIAVSSISLAAQYWQSTDGPPAASTCMVTNSKGHVIVGTPFSKVYRTTNRGVTWEAFDEGIDDGGANFYPVSQISVNRFDVLYAAVNGIGVLRSTNDGQTWQKLNVGITIGPNSRITVDTKTPDVGETQVFVGIDAGAANLRAQFSNDGGNSFIAIPLTALPGATSSCSRSFISKFKQNVCFSSI